MNYRVIAYYIFKSVEDPVTEVKEHKRFLNTLDSKGRIYIGKEGVNAQLSLHEKDLDAYLAWLQSRSLYADADVKIHDFPEHVFAKLTVKAKQQLVALDHPVDLSKRGEYLTPAEWRKQMESKDPDTIMIDVRNNYESKVGHFEGAICPDLETFREFYQYAKNLSKEYDTKKTKVMMYCTGGIRCELYSAVLKEEGFNDVYQLQGGVIRYGLEEGDKHWKGKLFVFDDRMVVPLEKEGENTIAICHFCKEKADLFYNCANMDCNVLFTACPACAAKHQGCCSNDCNHGRVRAFVPTNHPKPFRKLPHEEKIALKRE